MTSNDEPGRDALSKGEISKDALQAKGNFAVAAGTKVVAQVSLQGKPAQAVRFSLK